MYTGFRARLGLGLKLRIVNELKLFQVCKRTFLEDRIAKHAEVCHKATAKQRPVYDVVGARVGGTDAGELVATGKIKLEPAKPMAKKSELMKQYNKTGTESTFHSLNP